MKRLIASAALAAALAAPAFAQQPPATPDTVQSNTVTTQGQVAVQGAEPTTVQPTSQTEATAAIDVADAPQPQTSVTIDTVVSETPSATVETTTEIITPVSDRPILDAANPIAPEVHAIVAAKKNYTTADIVKAQHEAMLATPISQPTTVVTTTTTTAKPGG